MRIYHDVRKNQTREHEILCDVYCKNDNVDLCDVNRMIKSFALVKNRMSSSMPILSDQLAKFNKMNWRYDGPSGGQNNCQRHGLGSQQS